MNFKDRIKERDEHRLLTFFCIDEVEDLNSPIPFNVNKIEYEFNTAFADGISPGTNKTITARLEDGISWLGLWKVIDKLVKKSKDYHHIWIEEVKLSKTKDNTLEIFMGS